MTVSRIVQMAAHLAGRHAAGVEQTGLAQKGGPVVSDVRIASHPIDGAARASNRTADVLLGFDLFGAARPQPVGLRPRAHHRGRQPAEIPTVAAGPGPVEPLPAAPMR